MTIQISDETKDLMKSGKTYLEKNDLLGFYNCVLENLVDPNETSEQQVISEITWILDDCGINLWDAVASQGAIPLCFCISNTIPDEFMDNDCLHFPDTVHHIGSRAFYDSGNFKELDLRHIDFIEEEAFAYTNVEKIILDDTSIEYFLQRTNKHHIEDILHMTALNTIMIPKKYEADEDTGVKLLRQFSEVDSGSDIEIGYY